MCHYGAMSSQPARESSFDSVSVTAANIRALCARAGLTQSALGRAIGMSQRTVAERWWGKRQWQLEDLDRVAEALGTTPWLLCMPPTFAARPEGLEPPTFCLVASSDDDDPRPEVQLATVTDLNSRRTGAPGAMTIPWTCE